MTPERFAKLRTALRRRQHDLTVLAESQNKAHNVSAIVRSADAVGIPRIHAISTSGLIRRYHRIAGGAKQWVEIAAHASIDAAVAELRRDGWQLLAAHASPEAVDFRDVDYTQKVAIVVGSELIGLSAAAVAEADLQIAIPMQGLGQSLNVSVAAAVVLFEAERQRLAAGYYNREPPDAAEFARVLFEWSYPEIAELCRRRGRPYPPLTADGYLATNSFGASVTEDS